MSDMAFLDQVLAFALYPFHGLIDLGNQVNILTLIGAGLTALAFYLHARRGRRMSLKGAFHYLFPAKLIRHRSTLLDLKLYFIGKMFVLAQAIFVFSGAPVVQDTVLAWLEAGLGEGTPVGTPSITLTIAVTLLNLLAIELGYWIAHWLMHRIGWLWEFHKVHHSAEVMTPLTEWRQHPTELFLFPVLITATSGTLGAVMTWQYGPEGQVLELWGINAILLVFWYTILHLRHSHVNMHAAGPLAYLIQSPAHHHIHHSVEPRHHNKNLGYCLSVWDWAFGTLFLPERDQKIEFGLGGTERPPETLSDVLWTPCVRAGESLARSCGSALARLLPPQRRKASPGEE